MGPILLFDKSFLQSLSVDEAVWFDHFFLTNVCPIFYIETLADLKKPDPGKRTPEELVRTIAQKFPERNGRPNVHHLTACTANFLGEAIPNTGQLLLPAMRQQRIGGQAVAVSPEPPECEAFRRWSSEEFQAVEKLIAAQWRSAPLGFATEQVVDELIRYSGPLDQSATTLNDVLSQVDRAIHNLSPDRQLALAAAMLAVPLQHQDEVVARWTATNDEPLATFAPYAAHVFSVELFYHIAVHKSRIGAASRMDLMYLFYLPFCQSFVSTDWIHKECAPLFLQDDQTFVWGPDLKKDLKRINEYYSALPEAEKERGNDFFAKAPPDIGDSLVQRLWDKHLPSWRRRLAAGPPAPPEAFTRWLREHNAKLKEFVEAGSKPTRDTPAADLDVMMLQHTVHRRRGSWWQMPKDLRAS